MFLDDDLWADLFAYSEWLDQQGLLSGESDDDRRSHEDLVNQFFSERAGEDDLVEEGV